jgi:hypothetical protein
MYSSHATVAGKSQAEMILSCTAELALDRE